MQWLTRPVGWLVSALGFIAGFYGVLIGANATQHAPDVGWLSLLFLLTGWFPVILVHELGHAIAAQLVGWRVWIFHVAPFAFYTHTATWRFTGHMGGPDIGGFVLALPRNAGGDTWRRSLWVSLGGPLASWLFALVCLSVLWWLPQTSGGYYAPDDSTWIGGFIFALGCFSLSAALLSSWPSAQHRGNDGNHIAEKLARKQTFGIPQSGAALAGYLSEHGIPVSAMEAWMIVALERSGGLPSAAASDTLTGILDALVRGDMPAAQAACEQLERNHPHSREARAAQAFTAVWFNGDIAAADAVLSKLHIEIQDDCFRLRQLTLAAIHRLENEVEAAERVLNELMITAGGSYRFSSSAWEKLCRQVMQRASLPAQSG